MAIRGRLLEIEPGWATLQTETGSLRLAINGSQAEIPARPGDWVQCIEADGTHFVELLSPNRSAHGDLTWMKRILDPRRLRAMAVRDQVEGTIREFFRAREFREVRTPLLVPCPGMEPHIRPFGIAPGRDSVTPRFLPTSPEFAMKRLLVGGLARIFQICPAFRDEPASPTHSPEFTMLEWYRAGASYADIMNDTEALFEAIARRVSADGRPVIRYQGREISVAAPWPRLRVRELFQDLAGVDLIEAREPADLARECARLGVGGSATESWDDLYFRIWLNVIEPRLPADQAVFVTRYPASQAALAVTEPDESAPGVRWARRFEAYAGGLELANAFEELTDPAEQRARFEKDMRLREETYGPDFPASPLDEGFLGALTEGMPPAGGIALGVDRLVMLFADEPEIDYTLWLPSGGGTPASR